MPAVDVIDSTWIGVPPAVTGAALADASRWPHWWPDLDVTLSEARGAKGARWTVRSAERGRFAGTMEIWLEPVAEGAVAHYFLRLDLVDPRAEPLAPAEVERLVHHYRTQSKRVLWALSDRLDAGRLARVSAPPS